MEFTQHTFPPENTVYIAPTWEQLHELAFTVSSKLRESNHKFDRIVTLAKGGWPMSRSVVDFLQVPEVASVGIKFYKGINARFSEPQVYQDLPIAIQGESILLFDDVADSGESLEFAQTYLRQRGVGSVTTATLFFKPHSKVRPDYFGATTDAWIIFPYEVVDTINVLGNRWQAAGVSPEVCVQRFLVLGFPANHIATYWGKTRSSDER